MPDADNAKSQMALRQAQMTLEAEVQAMEATTKQRAERFKLATVGLEERTLVVKTREAELDAAAAKAEKTASELKTKKAIMNRKLQEAARKMEQTEQAVAAAQETLSHAEEVAKVRAASGCCVVRAGVVDQDMCGG
jgi:lipid II:glycine glycyltransferase (peptidoglycan interpeptide bridge formation enzyme)